MSTATLETASITTPMPIPTRNPDEVTPDDLLAMSDGKWFELVDGALVEMNVGKLSSLVGAKIVTRLTVHCEANNLGLVFGSDLGYRCYPGYPKKVRRPDASFVRLERLPADFLYEGGFSEVAPDLAVEVVSPNDLAGDLEEKVREYRAAGVPLVWVVYPEARVARAHRLDGSATDLLAEDHLEGEDVVPGFRVRLADLLPDSPAPVAAATDPEPAAVEVPSPS